MSMLEGDELIVHVEGRPEHVDIFEIGHTWSTCRNGDQVYWVACKFKGIRDGDTYRVIARMLRARDCEMLRLVCDLVCEKNADEFETYILESRLGYWRPK